MLGLLTLVVTFPATSVAFTEAEFNEALNNLGVLKEGRSGASRRRTAPEISEDGAKTENWEPQDVTAKDFHCWYLKNIEKVDPLPEKCNVTS